MEINERSAYDIGAFTGDTIGMLMSFGYTEIVCFEPHPDTFKHLDACCKSFDSVIAENYAVSSISGKKVTMISNPLHPYLNTLEQTWVDTPRHSIHYMGKNECQVETISLDDYINKQGSIPAYIKVDAEGHELEIFKGLSYKPNKISFEWVSEFHEKNTSCINRLVEIGFTKFKIGYTENIPTATDADLTAEECILKLKEINKSDTDKIVWGNLWCS